MCICLVSVFLFLLPIQTFAVADTKEATEAIYFEDGSSITIELIVQDVRASYTKRATKTFTFRNADNIVQWSAELIGSFRFDGTTSTCASSICNVSIKDSGWYIISKSATESDNIAKATLKMGYKPLNVTTDTKSIDMQITCDANGNIT